MAIPGFSRNAVRISDGDPQINEMRVINKRAQVDAVITSPLESNGALPVNIQDQHSLALDLRFIQAQGAPTTLTVQADPEDRTLTLASAAGFVAGSVVGLFTGGGIFYFGKQVGAAAGSVITLDTPIDKIFTIAATTVLRASDNMAVDGSGTTQIFQVGPVGVGTAIEVDVTRILGYIQSDSAMDDALFGNLTALTNGIVLRHNNTVIDNIWNVKTNGDLGLLCFDAQYTDKAPAGSFGYRFRNTYAGPSKHGVTIRLQPGDTLEVLLQDALQGLEVFSMMAQGHIVTD